MVKDGPGPGGGIPHGFVVVQTTTGELAFVPFCTPPALLDGPDTTGDEEVGFPFAEESMSVTRIAPTVRTAATAAPPRGALCGDSDSVRPKRDRPAASNVIRSLIIVR